jgi:hypothetical protein
MGGMVRGREHGRKGKREGAWEGGEIIELNGNRID